MILSCPSCKTRYNVDPAALREGKSVRCAQCGNKWHQDPPDDLPILLEPEPELDREPDLDSETEPETKPNPETGETVEADPVEVPDVVQSCPANQPQKPVSRLGWVVLAIVVVSILGAGIIFRNSIATAWPPSARLYEALWLSVETPSFGLELRNIKWSQTFDGDIAMLSITGQVVNVSEQARVVPRVRVGLTSEAGREIYHWTFVVPDRELQPGQTTGFSTTLASPPEAAKHLAVTFIEN